MTGPAQREGDAAPSAAQRSDRAEGAQLHGRDGRGADRHRARGRTRRGHHGGHAHGHRAVAGSRPRSPTRFFDVGIAEQHAMTLATGMALGGSAAHGRALLHVPPAGLRPGRPRRVPERRTGGHRRRPRRPRGRGRHQPPGHVHAARPAPAAQPRSSPRPGRAGAAPAAPHRVRAGRIRSRCTTPATRASTCRPWSRRPSRWARASCCARARTCSSSGSGPSCAARCEVAERLSRGWLVGGGHQRALRQAAGHAAHPGLRPRGKRLVVTLEESALAGGFGSGRAGGARGGGPRGRRPARASRCCASASPPTGSWTTARSRTCDARCAWTCRASCEQISEAILDAGHHAAHGRRPTSEARSA